MWTFSDSRSHEHGLTQLIFVFPVSFFFHLKAFDTDPGSHWHFFPLLISFSTFFARMKTQTQQWIERRETRQVEIAALSLQLFLSLSQQLKDSVFTKKLSQAFQQSPNTLDALHSSSHERLRAVSIHFSIFLCSASSQIWFILKLKGQIFTEEEWKNQSELFMLYNLIIYIFI